MSITGVVQVNYSQLHHSDTTARIGSGNMSLKKNQTTKTKQTNKKIPNQKPPNNLFYIKNIKMEQRILRLRG